MITLPDGMGKVTHGCNKKFFFGKVAQNVAKNVTKMLLEIKKKCSKLLVDDFQRL
jgi:hypothetical protein